MGLSVPPKKQEVIPAWMAKLKKAEPRSDGFYLVTIGNKCYDVCWIKGIPIFVRCQERSGSIPWVDLEKQAGRWEIADEFSCPEEDDDLEPEEPFPSEG